MPFKPADTALKIIVGPAIDDTDFKTREEAIAFNQAGMEVDVILEKHDGTIVTTAVTPTAAGDYDWAHTDQGYYSLELPASGGASFNNTEEGIITVAVFCTGVLPFRSVSYDIIESQAYDALIKGTDSLQVDAVQISGDTITADNVQSAFDGTGYGFTNCTMPTVSTLTGHTAQTGDSFARIGAPIAASISADLVVIDNFVDELESRLTAARAGYLDNLSAGAVAQAATALLNTTWTDAKAAFLNHSVATVDTNIDSLLTRITAARAGYLDNLSAGAVALASIATEARLAELDAANIPARTDGIQTDLDNATDGLGALKALIDLSQTDLTAIKAKTDNLPDGIKKNTAITAFTFLMVNSMDHVTAMTDLTVAGNYSGNGGAVAALTNTGAITEISNGLYEIDLTAGELNYENVTLIFTASGADARVITIHTSS